ncbi:hypothetical protein ABIB06_007825 [Bradyrhizobium sp. LB8.2]|uniref:hypothetical protein n=1 Tax=unclassified Bradyrhizobium TaxID=2631580 RepID=UPI00339B8389
MFEIEQAGPSEERITFHQMNSIGARNENQSQQARINSLAGTGKIEKLVLMHNHNDSNVKTKNKVGKTREAGMETAQRLRAMATLCRQSAALYPDRSWKLLAEAEYWEHLAATALSPNIEDCFTLVQADLAAAFANSRLKIQLRGG